MKLIELDEPIYVVFSGTEQCRGAIEQCRFISEDEDGIMQPVVLVDGILDYASGFENYYACFDVGKVTDTDFMIEIAEELKQKL